MKFRDWANLIKTVKFEMNQMVVLYAPIYSNYNGNFYAFHILPYFEVLSF